MQEQELQEQQPYLPAVPDQRRIDVPAVVAVAAAVVVVAAGILLGWKATFLLAAALALVAAGLAVIAAATRDQRYTAYAVAALSLSFFLALAAIAIIYNDVRNAIDQAVQQLRQAFQGFGS
jgi:hypothetical protein